MHNQLLITDVTGILLAGGKSQRMGEDKRFLIVGEQTLFERSLSVLRSVFKNVCVVIAQDSRSVQTDISVIRDIVPKCGSLGGLYTGLFRASTPYVFVVACDMPFLDPRTVRYFTEVKGDADVVIARLHNGLQPMHALYGRQCLPIMDGMIQAHELKIQQMASHPSLSVRIITPDELVEVDPEGRSFMNVNTPTDLAAARSLASGQNPRSTS